MKEVRDQSTNQRHDLEKRIRGLQDQNRSLTEDVNEAQADLSSLDRQYKRQLQELEQKHNTLQKTLNDVRADLENKSSILKTTHDRLLQREAESGQLESEVLRLKAQTGDTETLAIIKKELSDTVTHIRKLESTNREQSGELKHLRRIHKAVELVEEEKLLLENKLSVMEDLQRDLREAQIQRQILEDERQSWTSYLKNEAGTFDSAEFDSPEALARALVQQRLENVSLIEKIGQIRPELSEKDVIIKTLDEEREKMKNEAEKIRSSVTSTGDSRARTRLERQRALAVKEVEYLREQLRTFDSEEKIDEQNLQRINELECLVDQYRAELQTLNQDLFKREEQASTSKPQSLKRSRSGSPEEHLGQLSRKNRSLQDSLSSLQQTHSLLQADHSATVTQLNSLQKSLQTRILALRDNPTSVTEAIKQSTLTALRAENAALLARLEESNPRSNREGLQTSHHQLIPLETLNNVRAELQATEAKVADREKQILRNKQVYTKVASDLRQAVASLLGWRMDPMHHGRIRMTSLLHPSASSLSSRAANADHGPNSADDADGDNGGGGSLIFDGDTGVFTISGGPDSEFGREIRPLIKFWVEERKATPLFLAAVTMEFYDRSTKAARALGTG